MNNFVVDTMALVLRLEHRKIPKKVYEAFKSAESKQNELFIPAIVFAEIAYLSEKSRIDTNLLQVKKYLHDHTHIKQLPLTLETVSIAFEIDDIPELHDRLIAVSGKQLNLKVITNDPEIKMSLHVDTLWN